ncbi:MAG TPA: ABC transporter permease [Gemmatimonadaceae bacterium]|nr:ABC transporter permease [Gemmatimonadaceae bacterium]
MLNDVKYALRFLARARGFAIAVVLTLGLAIGANTAIFSVVRGVLLKPLPHRDGERLVYLRQSVNGPAGENIQFSVPEINDFRAGATSFQGIAEYSPGTVTLVGTSDAVRINAALVTGNYLQVMGLSTVLGRPLSDEDDGPGVAPVMLLTHDFWMKRFGGDPGVLGRVVKVNSREVEIIGVVQPAPFFPSRFDALLNMAVSPHHTSALMVQGRTHRMTEVMARLAPGKSVDDARAEVAAIRNRVQADHPDAYDKNSHYRVTVTPFQEVLGERARLTLWLLMGAAGFVLVIAVANVANLTLMRGVRREHELVVRAALGAGVGRLRKLLLVENLVLAVMGAMVGLVIAVIGMRLLVSLAERYSPRANEIQLDAVVLGFALLLSVGVALLLSFVASLPREGAIGGLIASGTNRSSASLRKQRLQRGLVVAQVAVSVVLLAGAGLLTRTMLRLADVKTGLTTENVLTMEVPLLGNGRSDAAAKELYERIRTEVAALPGVSEVGVGSVVPLRVETLQLDIKADGYTVAPGEAQPRAEFRTANPEYFSASGIPLLRGRPFLWADTDKSQLVVIVNRTLAEKLFPGRDPIGQRVAWTGDVLRFIGVSGDWRTIVGVVGDTKDGGLDAAPRPVVFHPFTQQPAWGGGLVIRATADASSLIPSVMRVVRAIVPTAPVENILTVAQVKDQSIAPRRLNAALVSSFGVLAVIIAAVGIAGVLAFSVSARTHEIGIRMSLGADSARVQRMVIMEGGVLLGIGLLLGMAAARAGSRLIEGLLFGVPAHDPLTLGLVTGIMAAIGIGACWLPAARAARIDPAITMRGS